MKNDKNDNSSGSVFHAVSTKISKFTKLDTVGVKSVYNTPIIKLFSSFVIVIIISCVLYLGGNILLILLNLSLAQFVILVSVASLLIFIGMMAYEENSHVVIVKKSKEKDDDLGSDVTDPKKIPKDD